MASTGQFLVGTSTPSGYSNRLLTVNTDDGDAHIEIRTANDHIGGISFSDTNAGNANAYSGLFNMITLIIACCLEHHPMRDFVY